LLAPSLPGSPSSPASCTLQRRTDHHAAHLHLRQAVRALPSRGLEPRQRHASSLEDIGMVTAGVVIWLTLVLIVARCMGINGKDKDE